MFKIILKRKRNSILRMEVPERNPNLECNFVTLIVGDSGKEIKVNKVKLSEDNIIFRNMFYNTHAGQNRILVQNVDPYVRVYEKFLRSIETETYFAGSTMEELWGMYRLYLQYDCVEFGMKSFNDILEYIDCNKESIWNFYVNAYLEQDDTIYIFRELLYRYATRLIQTRLMNIGLPEMWQFLYQQDDFYPLDECALLLEIENYVKEEPNLQDHPSVRIMLRNIRFLTMTEHEFDTVSQCISLIDDREKFAILARIKDPKTNIPYPRGFSISKKLRGSK